jgi:hypothetical protein
MLKTIILGFAAAASLSLGAGALTPALANYGHCVEQPDAADCRTYNMPGLPPAVAGGTVHKPIAHAHNHHHYAPQG